MVLATRQWIQARKGIHLALVRHRGEKSAFAALTNLELAEHIVVTTLLTSTRTFAEHPGNSSAHKDEHMCNP